MTTVLTVVAVVAVAALFVAAVAAWVVLIYYPDYFFAVMAVTVLWLCWHIDPKTAPLNEADAVRQAEAILENARKGRPQ